MDIRLRGECWCMTGLTPYLFSFWVVVVYPLFIPPVTIRCKKPFCFCRWSNCSYVKNTFPGPLASIHTVPNFLAFELLPMLLNAWKWLIEQLSMIPQVLIVFDMDLHRVMPSILHLQLILIFQHLSLSFTSKSPLWKHRN